MPGVTREPLAAGPDGSTPAAGVEIRLVRLRLEPGAMDKLSPHDAPLGLTVVESGSPTVRAAAPLVIHRRAVIATPGSTGETLDAGSEARLETGDFFDDQEHAVAELRNDAEEPAVLLTAATAPISDAATPRGTPIATTSTGGRGWPSLIVSVAIVVAPPCDGTDASPDEPIGTPGGGGGGTGTGGVAVAVAAGPDCSRPPEPAS